jgi:hypothetical protein
VLVVGGSVAACEERSSPGDVASEDANPEATVDTDEASTLATPDAIGAEAADDSSVSGDAITAEAADDVTNDSSANDGAQLKSCFCQSTPICCVQHEGGPPTVADGFRCCWGPC